MYKLLSTLFKSEEIKVTTKTKPEYGSYRIVKNTRGNGEVFYCVEKYHYLYSLAPSCEWHTVDFYQTLEGLKEHVKGIVSNDKRYDEFPDVAPLCTFVKRKQEERRIANLKKVVSTEIVACCSEPRSIN